MSLLTELIIVYLGCYKYSTPNGAFQPTPESFLVNATNCSSVTRSARICGDNFNSSNPPAIFSAGHSCFNNLNIILRRCEKLNFTKCSNLGSSSFDNSGCARRTNTTHAESTSGTGKKQSAGILKFVSGSYRNCSSSES